MSNPYALADADDVRDVKVDRTFVFGDSYSVTLRDGNRNWINFVKADGRTGAYSNFAVSGATAGSDTAKSFKDQVDAFAAQDRRANGGDLTVAYFGYNDLHLRDDLSASFADYKTGLNRLISLGATGRDQRLFVTMLHDWGRNPRNEDDLRQYVIQWNKWVADYANNKDRVVAVDMFTPFERIYGNPSKYGFDNVATVDAAHSDSTALYYDSAHFGERGQDIIAQVYEYYLTRGWDFSNTLKAGSEATAELNRDLDAGKVFSLADSGQPLQFFSLGGGNADPGTIPVRGPQTGFRSQFAQERQDGGIGLQYGLHDGFQVGVAFGDYSAQSRMERQLSQNEAQVQQRSVSIFSDADLGDAGMLGRWHSRTRVTAGRNDIVSLAGDDLIGSRNRAQTEGRSYGIGQRFAGAIRADGMWLTPSVSVDYSRQEVDGYRIANDYVGDTIYSGSAADELWATLGLAARLDPLDLGDDHFLGLTGHASWARSLIRDDHVVDIRQAGLFSQHTREVIEQEQEDIVAMGFDGTLSVGAHADLSAGYGLTMRTGEDDDHAVRIGFTWRF